MFLQEEKVAKREKNTRSLLNISTRDFCSCIAVKTNWTPAGTPLDPRINDEENGLGKAPFVFFHKGIEKLMRDSIKAAHLILMYALYYKGIHLGSGQTTIGD